MSEIATRPTGGLSPIASGITGAAGTVQLQEWAQELSAAHALGTALCGTDFVPKDFRGKPEAAAAAILAGKSLGLDPMNALSNIFVVQGRPALYARTMAALVMREGHEIIRTNATPQSVTYRARRKGSEHWQDFTWTIERAKLAGYTSNKKYQTDPVAMLGAKAQAEACRTIAPDVLTGVAAYSVEEVELDDLGEQPAMTTTSVAEPVKKKVTRKPRAAAPAPELPDVVNDAPQDEPEPEQDDEGADTETGEIPAAEDDGTQPADDGQIDAVVSALNAAGHATKAAKQAAIAEALGEQKSATQLTAFEAETLVTYFADEA